MAPCIGIGAQHDKPIPLPHNTFNIDFSGRSIHVSHRMYVYRGVYYCNKCGSYARHKVRKLNSECLKPTQAGIKFLKDIDEGKVPEGIYYSRFNRTAHNALINVTP